MKTKTNKSTNSGIASPSLLERAGVRCLKPLLWGGLVGLFFFGSCTNEDDTLDDNNHGTANKGDITFNIAIADEASTNPKTRVATGADFKSTFEAGDEIGIFAVRHASSIPASLATSGNYIHNVKLTYSTAGGGTWTVDPGVELWHATGNDVLDFYAYYPYNATVTDPSDIKFNVELDQSTAANYSKSDLLSAEPRKDVAKGATVNLTFAHKLALVQVKVDNSSGTIVGPHEFSVTLRNCIPSSTLNLDDNTVTLGTEAAQAIKMLRVEQASNTTSYTYRALVPAQTVTQGAKLCLMNQDENLYTSPALSAALVLAPAKAELYSASLPFTIHSVKIAAGTFVMGSPASEPNSNSSNETQHEVTLTKGFRMSKYQITFAQYDAFCDATGEAKPQDSGWGRGDRPVINMSWSDAVAFCAWVSQTTGLNCQLPTEAQWEYACRGDYSNKATETATKPFGVGDGTKLDYTLSNFYWTYSYDKNGSPAGEYQDNTNTYPGTTQSVGTYAPNNYGLYDMHGNVYEWCSDWYDSKYGSVNAGDPVADPTGPVTGSRRVLRGGSWNSSAQGCRSAYRYNRNPSDDYNSFGFRVVFVP